MVEHQLLQIDGVTKRFIGVTAVDQVDMVVHKGELLSLIGPNGSGKTTLFNCITGFLKPEEGQILFKEHDITSNRPDRITLKGISRTFQNVRLFSELTVIDNLLLSLQQFQEENFLSRILQTSQIRRYESEGVDCAMRLLEEVGMQDLRDEKVVNLVYGQRKMLEFLCALMPDPELVMLDEPAAGVSTSEVDKMKQYIVELNSRGKTFLVVEHNMGVVMDISHRIVVLDHGKKIAEGTPNEIQDNEEVREAYFGS